ncbi:MAG: hypothetical protein LUC98_04600, partial [Lachnospiraceae bacterium]|nr:hypothetical protein [Lachnospiraceae bacterium]
MMILMKIFQELMAFISSKSHALFSMPASVRAFFKSSPQAKFPIKQKTSGDHQDRRMSLLKIIFS